LKDDSGSSRALLPSLNTHFVGRNVLYYARLTSTMDVAMQKAHEGVAEGTVIMAGEQTEGRGRMKHHWLSPTGNIAMSVILYPNISSLPYLIMLASLSVVRSIKTVTGLEPQIKWPNDILISGKKVCGILIENEVKGSKVACAIIGIGINTELMLSDSTGISEKATSLNNELGRSVSHVDLVRHLLVEMERLYLTLPDGESIYEDWRNGLATLGKRVCVESGSHLLEGVAESVDRSGALRLRLADGNVTRVVAGDVTLRDK
jgi:BirA family biotin operon repressor/biotin-[acetyl-CoA-carboxylase] ligase